MTGRSFLMKPINEPLECTGSSHSSALERVQAVGSSKSPIQPSLLTLTKTSLLTPLSIMELMLSSSLRSETTPRIKKHASASVK